MTLDDFLEKVNDQKSFLEFARALQADKEDENRKEKESPSSPYSSGWNGWQNSSIETFLDAAIAWADASNFGENFETVDNLWKKFALFLYCGKIYE
jgi:hypothetical protein